MILYLIRLSDELEELKVCFTPNAQQLVVILENYTMLVDISTFRCLKSYEFGSGNRHCAYTL